MSDDEQTSGWSLVARRDEAARVLGTVVELDPDGEYSRSDLAEAAGVPLKTLYLGDTLEGLVEAGILERLDGGDGDGKSEARYTLVGDSEALAAARSFDEAVARNVGAVEAE